jgi:hypothetical protein
MDHLTTPLSASVKLQVDAALKDMVNPTAYTIQKTDTGSVLSYSWPSASDPKKSYHLNQMLDGQGNLGWVLIVDESLQP